MDTVPIMKGWSRAPFKAEIENKKLYGLGAADMKAGLAIILNVFKELKEDVNLILVATSDEEGNSNGAYEFLKTFKKDNIALCLIPEPTNEKIRLGCRGRFVVDIEIIGKSAHAARPTLGANAIVDCAKVIDALKKVKIRSHEKLGYGSLCPLKIEGGGDSLSIPQYCKIRVDRHVVPDETKKMILNDFKNALTNLDIKSEIRVSFMKRETPFLKPYLTDMKDEMVKGFCSEYKKFYGTTEIVYGKSVGDYNLFAEKMPTIVFGPKGESIHAPDEFVYTDSILRCRDLYLKFLRSLKN
jgi:acetylornithine deacetylase/succinyl-diaminopimelate desuccinylase-like protein